MSEKEQKNTLEIAEFAVREAGKYLRLRAGSSSRVISEKSSRDHLLTADIEAERIIIQILEKYFPDYGILSEEKGLMREKANLRWIIDPLDGSFNYQHGDVIYGVMLGLFNNTNSLLSVILIPELDEIVVAEKGKGTRKNGKIAEVSNISKLTTARIQFGDFARNDRESANKDRIKDLNKLAGKVGRVRMVGSSAVDFVAVATGIADGYLVRNPEPWDFLTGRLIIDEAGGKITKHMSSDGDLYIVSNGKIHQDLEELLL